MQQHLALQQCAALIMVSKYAASSVMQSGSAFSRTAM